MMDQHNQLISLTSLLKERPTIINFVYLNCPLLCHLLLDGLLDVAKKSQYQLHTDYQIVSISIDPNETTENILRYQSKYLNALNASNGWYFLRGDANTIQELTRAMGYQYQYIERTNDYAHPSLLYFYHQQIINYVEGVMFDLNAFEYSIMRIQPVQSIKEKIITFCYYFDPDKQTYSLYILNIMRLACLITVLILAIFILKTYKKDTNK